MTDSRHTEPTSLHPEAFAAAQAAAAAAGMTIDEWLSRIILENSGVRTGAAAPRAMQPMQAHHKDPLRAISHQLKIAEEAAGAAEMSVEEWLNRAILTAIDLDRRYRPHQMQAEQPPEPRLPDVSGRRPTNSTPRALRGPAATARTAVTPRGATFDWPPAKTEQKQEREPDEDSVEDRLADFVEAARRRLDESAAAEAAIEGIPRLPEDMAAIVLRPEFEEYGRSRKRLSRWITLVLLLTLTVIAAAVWLVPRFADNGVPLPLREQASEEIAVPPASSAAGPRDEASNDAPAATQRVERVSVPEPHDEVAPPATAEARTPATAPPPAAPAPEPQSPVAAAPNAATAEEPPPTPPSAHIDWYEKAGNGGDVEAQLVLARLYLVGDGVRRDYGKAAEWYGKAAEAGNADAQYALGVLRERGLGIAKSPAGALRMYEAAAAQGHLEAANNLGIAYFEGRVVSQDYRRALANFTKAAAAGLPEAQFNLALLYEEGLGVGKDTVTAYKWYALAKDGGERRAGAELERLAAGMSPEDMNRARRLVAEYKDN